MSFQRYLRYILRVPGPFCEAEVGYLSDSFVKEDVSYLEVPVHDALLRQVFETKEDFVDSFRSLFLRHGSFGPYATL